MGTHGPHPAEKRSACTPHIRAALELMVEMSLDAGNHAEHAVREGLIASGTEERFSSETRRRTYVCADCEPGRRALVGAAGRDKALRRNSA